MLTAKLILERLDKEGNLLERRGQKSKSFTKNFLALLYVAHAQILESAPYSITDITGAARDVDSYATVPGARSTKSTLMIGSTPGNAGMYSFCGFTSVALTNTMIEGSKIGIQVGTGVGVVAPTDVALGTRILHGTGAGLLEYGGCELVGIAFADPNGQFTIRRYFTNHSGGLITVQEAGIYAVGTLYKATSPFGTPWPFCIARDLTGAVPVNDTELLRVTYVVQITV